MEFLETGTRDHAAAGIDRLGSREVMLRHQKRAENGVITQSQLATYFGLKARIDELGVEQARLRQWLLERTDEGAEVEPGLYDLSVRSTETRRFTRANLEALLNKKVVAWLEAQLPVRVGRYVRVGLRRASETAHVPGPPGPQSDNVGSRLEE
jgi:hypothetical protein